MKMPSDGVPLGIPPIIWTNADEYGDPIADYVEQLLEMSTCSFAVVPGVDRTVECVKARTATFSYDPSSVHEHGELIHVPRKFSRVLRGESVNIEVDDAKLLADGHVLVTVGWWGEI